MDLKCPNLVCSSHMTWYIARNIQNKLLWYILTAFYWNIEKCLAVTNLGHCDHMTWYILNIPDNFPGQDVMVASIWYILNILTIYQFGTVLVHRSRPYNVLAMYQVSTSPLAPSVLP